MMRSCAVALACLLATGCAGTGSGSTLAPVAVLETGSHCPLPPEQAGAVQLRDEAIDHDQWRVRLGMGRRSTGGYSVTIAEPRPLAVEDGVAVVRVDWRSPDPDDPVSQVITRPCVEVAVPDGYRGVRFVDGSGITRGAVMRE